MRVDREEYVRMVGVMILPLGQQQCTAGFRDTPPTRRANVIYTVHPNSCPWLAPLELQHQSNFNLSQPYHPSPLPHPTPDASNSEAKNQHQQLLEGGYRVLRCRLIGNTIDLF